jgi:hypothetical protein
MWLLSREAVDKKAGEFGIGERGQTLIGGKGWVGEEP